MKLMSEHRTNQPTCFGFWSNLTTRYSRLAFGLSAVHIKATVLANQFVCHWWTVCQRFKTQHQEGKRWMNNGNQLQDLRRSWCNGFAICLHEMFLFKKQKEYEKRWYVNHCQQMKSMQGTSVPRNPGIRKSKRDHNSSTLFWIGVPLRINLCVSTGISWHVHKYTSTGYWHESYRCSACIDLTALAILLELFLMTWPSSNTQ